MLEEKASAAAVALGGTKPPKPLSLLMKPIPQLPATSPHVHSELLEILQPAEGHPAPLTYLTPDQIDDYLFDFDTTASKSTAPLVVRLPSPPGQHDRELALRNPNSVYNWLRKNEPKVFLQDNEGSEKSLGKPGALRGAGKRASIPAPSKPDALEFVEEDGIGYDASIAGPAATKGKRKRDEADDGAYHPKAAGKLDETGTKRVKRPYNRKKKPENGEEPAAPPKEKKKGGRKPKEKGSSPPRQDFGGLLL
ncbi:IEC3 subunit of the Ino80 complex, chromatin re-modelling-domain-containing protein [Amylocarpus encephaloides]|uniref:IEC3 subunit of the Ino80 complex, chromatin re-modelling-domain-containing protein n=1 Tax=Amylocarpus encephaloides TaxID=45428 RepID=A0A9P8C7H8_9HELO|nr:IEC3 subunit of the Ino80 complex, chromatin re-modelling-domain-containing protein [Amylocarpus encephaloides]